MQWGAAIAQWIRLHLLSCHPGFESKAHYHYSQFVLYLPCEKNKSKQKVAGFCPYLIKCKQWAWDSNPGRHMVSRDESTEPWWHPHYILPTRYYMYREWPINFNFESLFQLAHTPAIARGFSLIDCNESFWKTGYCPYRIRKSGNSTNVIERVDHGATFYKKFFFGQGQCRPE